MAAAVPVIAFLPAEDVVTTSARPERFIRICIRHRMPVEESIVEAGHGHVEVMACPGTQYDIPHRVLAWGVYDLLRARCIAVGSDRRIILLEGLDVPSDVVTEHVPDVPTFVDQVDAAYEKSGRQWMRAMANLPAAPPRRPAGARSWNL